MIPALPGTYVLVLGCTTAEPSKSAESAFSILRPAGTCMLAARSVPAGLRGRISHHVRRNGRPHWLIDYFRWNARLESVWYYSGVHCEHEWASGLGATPGAAAVLRGFGSSDCNCASHLFRFRTRPTPVTKAVKTNI